MAAFNAHAVSYSALKKFENCPRQYAEVVVHRNFQDVFTSANGAFGDKLHSSAEDYVKHKVPLDNEFAFMRDTLDVLRAMPGEKLTEHRMSVRHDGSVCNWNASDRWIQGIADLVIVGESPTAFCLDYKTGDAKYADTDQLEMMALLIFACFPKVDKVKGRLLFVLSNRAQDRTVLREGRDALWQKYVERDARRVAAIHADNFPAYPTGLCRKHCVVTSCEHNGRN